MIASSASVPVSSRWHLPNSQFFVVIEEMPMTPVGKIFKPRLREIAVEDAARELLAQALPGVAIELKAGHRESGLVLQAKVPASAAEVARSELGNLPIGLELVAGD